MNDITNSLSVLKEYEMFTHLVDSHDAFLHKHDYYEFFYILNGNITHFLNNKKYNLIAGDFVFLRPEIDNHHFIRQSGEECTHRDIIICEDIFKATCNYLNKDAYKYIINNCAGQIYKLSLQQLQYFEQILNDLNTAQLNKQINNDILSKLASSTLISTLYNLDLHKSSNMNDQPVWFKELISRFNEVKNIKFGLNKILENTYFNRIYICKVFKEHIGITMTEYLNNIRLNYASLYLKTTALTIEQIVEELGFSSTTYFYNCFKQKYGCSPLTFKKSQK